MSDTRQECLIRRALEMSRLRMISQTSQDSWWYRLCDWKINTALVERVHLGMRQREAAIGRGVNTRCQGEDGVQPQRALCHVYHNFVRAPAACARHCELPRRPTTVAQPRCGNRVHWRWRRD